MIVSLCLQTVDETLWPWHLSSINRPQQKAVLNLLPINLSYVPSWLLYPLCVCLHRWIVYEDIGDTKLLAVSIPNVGRPITHKILHFSLPVDCYVFVLLLAVVGCCKGLFIQPSNVSSVSCNTIHLTPCGGIKLNVTPNKINQNNNTGANILTCSQRFVHWKDEFIVPISLLPEAITAESRQPSAIQQFSSLPLIIGQWPEPGGALEWGQ